MTKAELIFLGTGGGRFATITQTRRTGGIRVISSGLNLHIDPGPGALIYSLEAGLNPRKLGAVLISHRHPDHCSNAEIMVEAMTNGTLTKRGIVAAPPSVLLGNSESGPTISTYHQKMTEQTIVTKPGVSFNVGDATIEATEARHSDPEAVGFRLEIPEVGAVGYTGDTEYFEGIAQHYRGVKILILSVMRPTGSSWSGHMTPREAARIVDEVKPEIAVATHFGMKMVSSGPAYEVRLIEEITGVPTVAAFDGMKLVADKKIAIKRTGRKQVR